MIMANGIRATVRRPSGIATETISPSPKRVSELRIDIALLASALFLQRFSLSFGQSLMTLDIVPTVLILFHQFASGRLLILYDRLLWFFVLGVSVTCSLYLNFNSTMLPSYSLFIVYILVHVSRSAPLINTDDNTGLSSFYCLFLPSLAIIQFFAQFLLDGRNLSQFYGVIPEFLLASLNTGAANTIIPIAGDPP